MDSRWTRPALVTVAAIAAVTVTYALLAYSRRWISDDGLIAVRTVRELLAGNGPRFNAFERAEANTSSLWTYLVALVAWVSSGDVGAAAVATGGVLAVGGVALAMDATRRWQRARGSVAPLVPFGILVVIGVFPFWDYATSGLESGLCLAWLGGAWWLLVRLRDEPSWRVQAASAFVFGLGPLVRPDFAIGSIVFFTAQILLARPTRWQKVAVLATIGVALPCGYEVFRAGYYGTLVPLPALAKGASGAAWGRGFEYLRDFAQPYLIFIPIGIAGVLLLVALRRIEIARRDRIVLVAPLITATLLIAFVARVGGDFMHARMCLPPLFIAMAPAALIPLRRYTIGFAAAMVVWAVTVAVWRGDNQRHTLARMVEDERYGYARWTKDPHPDVAAYRAAEASALGAIDHEAAAGRRRFLSEGGLNVPMNPDRPGDVTLAVGRLGAGGVVTPLDGIVADTLGLANPIGARITATNPGITGHEKSLPWPWLLADFGDADADLESSTHERASAITAARHAMSCGALAELLESARAPLTAARFWSNLTGSIARTRLVIPSDPFAAEIEFCGIEHAYPDLRASSSYEQDGWSLTHLADGVLGSTPHSLGFSSAPGEPQWVELDLRGLRVVSKVTLYPRVDAPNVGLGFPIDFTIQIWDGTKWVDRVTRTAYASPGATPQEFALPTPERTSKVRLVATKLPITELANHRLQLAEITVD